MITKHQWGRCKQGPVDAYTLDNGKDLRLTVLTLGGAMQRIEAFGVDVTLGYDTLEEYAANSGYFGALVGRVANRIAGAEITVDGVTWSLTKNRGEHMIHGGTGQKDGGGRGGCGGLPRGRGKEYGRTSEGKRGSLGPFGRTHPLFRG